MPVGDLDSVLLFSGIGPQSTLSLRLVLGVCTGDSFPYVDNLERQGM